MSAIISGSFREIIDEEVKATSAALKRAVGSAGRQVQTELREQARSAGMVDGGKAVANAWRLRAYPSAGVGPRTLRPSAQISSNVPEIVEAFEEGPRIAPKKVGGYLAIPTAINREGGRRGGKPRVTIAQMMQPGSGAFVIPLKSRPGKLWCIRVNVAQAISRRTRRGRSRNQVYAGSTGVQLFTSHMRGISRRIQSEIKAGYVSLFILVPSVKAPKLLNVAAVRSRSAEILASSIARELGALP